MHSDHIHLPPTLSIITLSTFYLLPLNFEICFFFFLCIKFSLCYPVNFGSRARPRVWLTFQGTH